MAKTCPWCGRNDGSCDVDAPNVKVVCVEFIDYSHINPDGSMPVEEKLNNLEYSNNL